MDAGHFEADAAEGVFRFPRCGGCGRWQWPPLLSSCPQCGEGRLAWSEVAGSGTLVARCEVHRGVDDPFAAETPYPVVVVRLDEGFPFITRPAGIVAPRQRVRLEWRTIHGRWWPMAVGLSG